MHDPRDRRQLVADEIHQRRTSGFDVTEIEYDAVASSAAAGDPSWTKLLDRLSTTQHRMDWRYEEPDGEADIIAALPEAAPVPSIAPATLTDRLLGAWLGRCAGCALGKPIEGWSADVVGDYLRSVDAWPPTDYLPIGEPFPVGYPTPHASWPRATRGRISGMPRDDDIDYTILGLHLLETHGLDFSTDDVAAELLDHLAFTQVFTAERVAYGNLVDGLRPPATASFRNPYREWIGALIRADIFGFVSPGDARRAAELAFRDARLTHTGNGIYAAMWSAATISAALAGHAPRDAVETGLNHVPSTSRLHEAVGWTLDLHTQGIEWEDAIVRLHERFSAYHWVHAINNAAAITLAVIWGAADFGRTIGIAVAIGLDTDSAGATAGSIAGATIGAKAMPPHWIDPLEDRIRSSITGFDDCRISELAARTGRLAVET